MGERGGEGDGGYVGSGWEGQDGMGMAVEGGGERGETIWG